MPRVRYPVVLLAALMAGVASIDAADEPAPPPKYQATFRSLEKHQAPAWFEDAKLGIFIHWGLYSVPAWATPTGKLGTIERTEWFRNNPYAEWYLNTLRITDSPTQVHHRETYGVDFDYYAFAEPFDEAVSHWEPDAMAQLLADVHARYVVLTTKHHDGFALWPSDVPNPHLAADRQHATRDIVGELSAAVRTHGMRMGLYYSGGIDWSFFPVVIDGQKLGTEVTPPDPAYAAYADAHLRELVARYQPSVIWNDIRYPGGSDIQQIVADYYNAQPDGLINNRWGSSVLMPHDFTTPEYRHYDHIVAEKWESCRGIGYSFGYNQVEGPEHMLSVDELVDSFIDIVSKNGNLLLNVGPKPDGTLSELQVERLRGLGRWLDVNGEAIFGTRPWVDFQANLRDDAAGVRFTWKPGTVFAFLLQTPAARDVAIEGVIPAEGTSVRLFGYAGELAWHRDGDALVVRWPEDLAEVPAYALAITPEPARLMRK